jgi:exodeoxyribonuclease VII large subunit
MKLPSSDNQAIWSVSALNFEVKTMLTEGIGTLWIEGEISNFACPASGHWYFSLKDPKAQCRAAMFKGRNQRIGFQPKNGQKVLVRAQVTLYEARGEFQLVVDHMEDAGIGELMRQYEQLKKKLDQEGLFALANKRKIPAHPSRIGIITSATGAALRDCLSVIKRRAAHIPVVLIPSVVQGEQGASSLNRALNQALAIKDIDVLLIIRGGGSLEDLWCFNDEAFVRAVAACSIPIISGIGHEIDFTLTDFAADLRAPTPSVAAESATPDSQELMQLIDEKLYRSQIQLDHRLIKARQRLDSLTRQINQNHPGRQLIQTRQRLQHLTEQLINNYSQNIISLNHRQKMAFASMIANQPGHKIQSMKHAVRHLHNQNLVSIKQTLTTVRHSLAMQTRSLDNLSPLKTLGRGFATISKNKKLVTSVVTLEAGDQIDLTLADGQRTARIEADSSN